MKIDILYLLLYKSTSNNQIFNPNKNNNKMIQLENPIYVIKGGQYSGDISWNSKYNHSDDCYKLYHITSGDLWIDHKEGREYLKKGGLYLINGHKLLSYGTDSEFTTDWIHFNAQNIILSNTMYQLPMLTQLPKCIIDIVENLECRVICDINSDNFNHIARIGLQGVLQLILARAFQINSINISEESENLKRIKPAIEYIHNNLSSTIKLETLSACCCFSISHFCKIFKSVMNYTPNQFILNERMNLASRLIHSGTDIKCVAAEVGCYDDAHFCRVFKAFFGVTPSKYRNHNIC